MSDANYYWERARKQRTWMKWHACSAIALLAMAAWMTAIGNWWMAVIELLVALHQATGYVTAGLLEGLYSLLAYGAERNEGRS